MVDVLGEDDETLREKLAQAGMVIITGGDSPADVRGALHGVRAGRDSGGLRERRGHPAGRLQRDRRSARG